MLANTNNKEKRYGAPSRHEDEAEMLGKRIGRRVAWQLTPALDDNQSRNYQWTCIPSSSFFMRLRLCFSELLKSSRLSENTIDPPQTPPNHPLRGQAPSREVDKKNSTARPPAGDRQLFGGALPPVADATGLWIFLCPKIIRRAKIKFIKNQ